MMVVIDGAAVLTLVFLVNGILLGRLIGLMLVYYDIPERVMDAAYRLHRLVFPPPPFVLTPDMERAAREMSRIASSFGLSRDEIVRFSERLASLSREKS